MIKNNILIIEDSIEVSSLLTFMLEKNHYEILSACDGKEARMIIDQIEPPSLVILDLVLPYYSGEELLDFIQKKEEWKHVPIIILSSKSKENNIVDCLEHGAVDYITKPFNVNELLARVKRALQRCTL